MKTCLDVSVRKGVLAVFIRFLEDRLGYVFNVEEEFDKRFFLQKYVFLGMYFGSPSTVRLLQGSCG